MLLLALLACHDTTIKIGGPSDPGNVGTDSVSNDDSAADAPPIALIAALGPASVGTAVLLDGSGSYDPDGDALSAYAWACNDGQTATGARATLLFTAGVQTCSLLVTANGGLTGTTSTTFTVSDVAASPVKWTVLVFMNGDNDLEEWALGDMNELEQVGSTDDVNFIVQIDRSPDYSRLDGDWTGTRRFRAEADSSSRSIGSPVLEDLGETDAGDPSTVIDFAEWGIQNFPAEHYMLIIWDHGWGWSVRADGTSALQKGISWDESTNSDISPANGELLDIVEAVGARIGGKLDVLGMDACTMANWEIAQQMRGEVDVYLASQDYEGSDGYDYTGFADLTANPELDAAGLASSVALHFHEIPDSTMSAIDLSKMDGVTAELNNVADALLASADPAAMLTLAAADAQGFDGNRSTDHDLADMLDKLAEMDATADGADPATASIVAAAIDARSALDGAIITNYNLGGAVKNANGLSLYSPVQGRVDNSWFGASWAAETSWGDFLQAARAR